MLVEYENQYNHPPSAIAEETKPKRGYSYNEIMKGNRNVKYLTLKTYVKKYKRRPLS